MKVLTNRTISSFINKLSNKSLSSSETLSQIEIALSFINWLSSEDKISQNDSIRYRSELHKAKKHFITPKALSLPFPLKYVGFSLAVLSLLLIGTGIYLRFYKNTKTPFAYSTAPVQAGRIISFQGRLTDTLGNPINAPIDITYNFYTQPTGGTAISGSTRVCTAGPDQDGVFSSLIGNDTGPSCNTEMPSSIFTENPNVYLGVTIGSEITEMSPRQQIANVGYAINSETLQGMPPGQNVSNVPFINKDGNLLIAAANPGLRSTYASANFVISSAQATTIQSAGSGDITLSASEGGSLRFKAYNGTLAEVMTILNTGNVGIGNTNPQALLDVGGNATLSGSLVAGGQVKLGEFGSAPTTYGDGSMYYDTSTNKVYFWNGSAWTDMGSGATQYFQRTLGSLAPTNITDDLNIGAIATGSAMVHLPGLTDKDAFFNLGTGKLGIGDTSPLSLLTVGNGDLFQIDSTGRLVSIDGVAHTIDDISGNLTLTSNSTTISLNDNVTFAGTTTLNGIAYTWPGSQNANYVLQSNGTGTLSWVDPGGTVASAVPWFEGAGILYPKNSTVDAFIGGQATSSAKFAFLNVNSGTPTASISGTVANVNTFVDGNGNISTTNRQSLVLGNSATYNTTGNILLNPNGTGNVGIGTTGPTAILNIEGSQPISVGTSTGTAATDTLVVSLGTGGNTTSNGYSATGGRGADISLTTGTGGVANNAGSISSGGDGGTLTLIGGVGGQATKTSAMVFGGNGGGFTFTGGVGGLANGTDTLTAGGTGGAFSWIAGTGGAATETSGTGGANSGNGGAITIRSGTGGLATSTNGAASPGAGGALTIQAGTGGAGTGGSPPPTGGNGGSLTLAGGVGGTGSSNGVGGDIFFRVATTTSLATAMTIIKSGNVGIGTTSPLAKLDVNGTASISGALSLYGTPTIASTAMKSLTLGDVNTGNIYLSPGSATPAFVLTTAGNVGIGTTSPTSLLDIAGNTSSSGTLSFRGTTDPKVNILNGENFGIQTSVGGDGGLTERLTVLNSGNVGIGTTAPAGKLDLTDTSNAAASLSLTNNTATTIGNGANTLGVLDLQSTSLTTGNFLNIELNGLTSGKGINLTSTSMGLTGDLANFTASGSNAAVTGSVLKVGLTGALSTGTALNVTTAGASGFGLRVNDDGTYTDSTPFVVDYAGNVGIGTTAPAAKLDVSGNLNVSTYATVSASLALGTSNAAAGPGNLSMSGNLLTSGNVTFSSLPTGIVHSTSGLLSSSAINLASSDVSGLLSSINGGTGADNSTAAQYSIPYYSATGVMGGVVTPGTTGYVLSTNSTGAAPSWISTSGVGTNYWNITNGAIYPNNSTIDAFIGGQATSSAKFAFLNVNSGTPTASISGSVAGNALYLTGDGTISTSLNRSLILNPNGGNVGIGTTNPGGALHINSGTISETAFILQQSVTANYPDIYCKNNAGTNTLCEFRSGIYNNGGTFYSANQMVARAGINNDTASTALSLNDADGIIFGGPALGGIAVGSSLTLQSTSGVGATDFINFKVGNNGATEAMRIINSGNVGIGTTGPTAKLDVNGNLNVSTYATVSASLALGTSNAAAGPGNLSTSGTVTFSSLPTGIIHSTSGVLSSSALNLASEVTGLLSSTNGGTGADNSTAAQYSIPYYSATGVMGGVLTPGSIGYVLSTNGVGGAPSWISTSGVGTNYWNITNGAIYPVNTTLDMFVGGIASSSAKFAFLNSNSGTPTASISGSIANVKTFVDGNGNISTTNRQNLTLGNSSTYNTTGSILLNPNGTGNVGIGTTNPGAKLEVAGQVKITGGTPGLNKVLTSDADGLATWTTFTSAGVVAGSGTLNYIAKWTPDSGTIGNSLLFDNGTNVGIGTTSPTAKLDIVGDASTSGSLVFRGTSPATVDVLNGGRLDFQISDGGDTGLIAKMSVLNNGSVGIGTTGPTAKLHLYNGQSHFEGNSAGATVINSNVYGLQVGPLHNRDTTAGTYYSGIAFNHLLNYNGTTTYNGAPQGWIGTLLYDTTGSERDSLVFATKEGTGTSGTGTDIPTPRMVINPFGNVGIGTTGPVGKLDVTDTSNTAASFSLTNNTATTIGAGANTLGVIDLQSTSLTTGNLLNGEANALTSGKGLNLSSTSTGLTGDLVKLTASGSNAAVTGNVLKVGLTGALATGTALNVTSAGTSGFALRVNDDGTYTDSTPFVVDYAGNVGVGLTNPTAYLDLAASTTSQASLNLSSSVGTDPSTPISGDFWWNGTNLNFYNGSSSTDILAGAIGGLSWTDGGTFVYPTDGKILGNPASGGANKIAGLYLADSAPVTFGNTNDVTFSYVANVLSTTLGNNAWNIASNLLYLKGSTNQIGIGTTNPLATLDIRALSSSTPVASISGVTNMASLVVNQSGLGDIFTASDSGQTRFVIKKNGNVGIGVANPTGLLSIAGSSSTISNSSGDITFDSASNNISFSNDNLISVGNIASIGQIQFGGFAGAPTAIGNGASYYDTLVNKIFYWDGGAWSEMGSKYWQRTLGSLASSNITDDLNIGAIATGSAMVHLPGLTNKNAFFNLGTGSLGVGTPTPNASYRLHVNGNILVNAVYDTANPAFYVNPAGDSNLGGNISMYGDIAMTDPSPLVNSYDGAFYNTITLRGAGDTTTASVCIDEGGTPGSCSGKLDAGTIDPPYTINGDRYATFLPAMIGVKEETTGKVFITEKNEAANAYIKRIELGNQTVGSDLWLFSKVTNLKDQAKDLMVLLSSTTNGKIWYTVNPSDLVLTLYSTTPTEISYRLTAPRFDSYKWSNARGEGEHASGFTINDRGNIMGGTTPTYTAPQLSYQNNVYSLIGNFIEEFTSANKALFGQITTGILNAQKIVSTEKINSPIVETNEIKPIGKNITVILGPSDSEGTPESTSNGSWTSQDDRGKLSALIIKGLNNKPVVTIDAEGNATFAGTLTAQIVNSQQSIIDSLEANNATISGTLVAKNIQSENISYLENRMNIIANAFDELSVNSVKQSQTQIASSSATPRNDILAEQINSIQSELASLKNQPLPNSAYYQNIDASYNNVTVSDTANIYKAHISESLVVGSLFIEPTSILALSSDLRISSLGTIRLFDDAVVIAKNGNIAIKGGITASSLAIKNKEGITVASIDASGSARFNEVIAKKFTLDQIATQGALIADSGIKNLENIPIPAIKTNAEVAGIGSLPQDTKEIIIYNDNVTADSLIYLTPTTNNIQGQLSVTKKSINPPYFVVSSNNAIHSASAFNWLIIN